MMKFKLLKIQKYFTIFTNLKFSIFILILIALGSSLGSFIEQDEVKNFYEENYPLSKPIYGFITYKIILNLGLDHVYRTWWFILLLIFLVISLMSCTITRQFPLFLNSKTYFFKTKKESFKNLPFYVKFQNVSFLKEIILLKIQELNFYVYQNKNIIYGYKGLVGRVSPILVHFSLITILLGSFFGAFENFKAQEILAKGEIFHIQNTLKIVSFTKIPNITVRVNDFWVEYEKKKVHQFYSNLSILDNSGNELKNQTISVNNPLKYKNVDFYQSDWNLVGIRVKFENLKKNEIFEYPLFSLKENTKSWITWLPNVPSSPIQKNEEKNKKTTTTVLLTGFRTIIFDQLENTFLVYNEKGEFVERKNLGESFGDKNDNLRSNPSTKDSIDNSLKIIEIVPSTGLLVKYDPSIPIIYAGFGLLMLTTLLSYLPYTQLWIYNEYENSFLLLGAVTNRGKIQLEIEFENLTRFIETKGIKNKLTNKKSELFDPLI